MVGLTETMAHKGSKYTENFIHTTYRADFSCMQNKKGLAVRLQQNVECVVLRNLSLIVICSVHKSQVVPVGSYPEIHGTKVSTHGSYPQNQSRSSTTMVPSYSHIEQYDLAYEHSL